MAAEFDLLVAALADPAVSSSIDKVCSAETPQLASDAKRMAEDCSRRMEQLEQAFQQMEQARVSAAQVALDATLPTIDSLIGSVETTGVLAASLETKRRNNTSDRVAEISAELQCLTDVDELFELDSKISSLLESGDVNFAACQFFVLAQAVRRGGGVYGRRLARHAEASSRAALLQHAQVLATKLQAVCAASLAGVGWPKCDGEPFVAHPEGGVQHQEQLGVLCRVQVETELLANAAAANITTTTAAATVASTDVRPQSIWLIDVLLAPIADRFAFHFLSKRETNKATRPRWVFTWLLRCAHSAHAFLGGGGSGRGGGSTTLQHTLSENGLGHCSALGFFLRGLVTLAREKLSRVDFSSSLTDSQFSSIVDEAISFDRSLELHYRYSSLEDACPWTSFQCCSDVFTLKANTFNRWLFVDAKAAEMKFGAIEAAPGAWDPYYAWQKTDDLQGGGLKGSSQGGRNQSSQNQSQSKQPPLRPTQFAVAFSSLFSAISDRYRALHSQEHQLYFFEYLQQPLLAAFLEAVDNRRAVLHGGFTRWNWAACCSLLETLQTLKAVLQDTDSDFMFLEMKNAQMVDMVEKGQRAKRGEALSSSVVGMRSLSAFAIEGLQLSGLAARPPLIGGATRGNDGDDADESGNDEGGSRRQSSPRPLFSVEQEVLDLKLKEMISDSVFSVKRTFAFLTKGYARQLFLLCEQRQHVQSGGGGDSGGGGGGASGLKTASGGGGGGRATTSAHFCAALGWMEGMLSIARRVTGQITFDEVGRAVCLALSEHLTELVGNEKLTSTREAGTLLHQDILSTSATLARAGFSSSFDVHAMFSHVLEAATLLSLSDGQVETLLSVLPGSGGDDERGDNNNDRTADAHLEAMLAAFGVTRTGAAVASKFLKRRKGKYVAS